MTQEILKLRETEKKKFFSKLLKRLKIYTYFVSNPKILIKKISNKLITNDKYEGLDYKELYLRFGQNAVIDHRHSEDQYEYVTNKQKNILFPLLKKNINAPIKKILDFGCGTGRFTYDLKKLFNCYIEGVDTSKYLISLCKKTPNTKFFTLDKNYSQICNKYDLIFICHVLNGISDEEVSKISKILTNCLNKNGYLFIVEITGKNNIAGSWQTRTVDQIKSFFLEIKLDEISKYIDIDNEVTIFLGQNNT